jgi:hypothetical protein
VSVRSGKLIVAACVIDARPSCHGAREIVAMTHARVHRTSHALHGERRAPGRRRTTPQLRPRRTLALLDKARHLR